MKDKIDELYAMRHSISAYYGYSDKGKWPDAKFWCRPVVENGFYYDVDLVT